MKSNEIFLPHYFYLEHLQTIDGIRFTPKEIDIISFIISGRSTKKIASFFFISPRTVDNYIRNIMLKLDYNSRERIIDFIEKSNKINLMRKHYSYILIRAAFATCLQEIAKLVNHKESAVLLIQGNVQDFQVVQLKNDLKNAGVTLLQAQRNEKELKPAFLVFLDENSDKYNEINSLKMDFQNYYESIFLILKKAFPDIQLEAIVAEFRKKCEAAPHQSLGEYYLPKTTREYLKSSKTIKVWICLIVLLIFVVPFYYRHNFERDFLLKERGNLVTSWINQYEAHFNKAISHAKFYEWRGNALNITQAYKISNELIPLEKILYKDIETLNNTKTLFEKSILVFSPLNWNLFRELTNMFHKKESDLCIAASFNKSSQIMSHDTFNEAISELDSVTIKYLMNESSKFPQNDPRKKRLNTYLAIAINMRNGVAKKRMLDTKEADKFGYINDLEALIKELSWSIANLDNTNIYTFLNLHRINIECALREENHTKKNQFEEAAKLFLNRSIQLAQHETAVLQEMAYHYKYTKEHDRALLAYDSALKLEPNHAGLLYGRAELFLRMGEENGNATFFNKALNDIKKAIQLKPNDCDMIHLLVWASMHAESCDKATYALEKQYKPLCVAGKDSWDDMSGIRDGDVKWLEKKLRDKCSMQVR
jgi:DNA-binding CsgD family transcriptional regulator